MPSVSDVPKAIKNQGKMVSRPLVPPQRGELGAPYPAPVKVFA
jgi:hypothetical protein